MNKPLPLYHIEATPDGVNVMVRNNNNLYEHIELISFVSIPERLNAGEWDDAPVLALRLSAEYLAAGDTQRIILSYPDRMRVYRWVVAFAFMEYQASLTGGKTVYTYTDGKVIVKIPLYPEAERLAIVNNIEGALIGKFGAKQGAKNTTLFYSKMLTVEKDSPVKLSDYGIEVMNELHDSMLSEFLSNGGVIEGIKYDA